MQDFYFVVFSLCGISTCTMMIMIMIMHIPKGSKLTGKHRKVANGSNQRFVNEVHSCEVNR